MRARATMYAAGILRPRPALHRFVREDHLLRAWASAWHHTSEQQRDRPQTKAEPLVRPIIGRY